MAQAQAILNFKGQKYCIVVSTVTRILLNRWILPIGDVALGGVCAKPAKQGCFTTCVSFVMVMVMVMGSYFRLKILTEPYNLSGNNLKEDTKVKTWKETKSFEMVGLIYFFVEMSRMSSKST